MLKRFHKKPIIRNRCNASIWMSILLTGIVSQICYNIHYIKGGTSVNKKEYEKILEILSQNKSESANLLKILDAELSLPNIPFPTMGGEVFWNTLVASNGWKLQQNMITHHARILNDENVRIAWGTINGMEKAMKRMVESLHTYEKSESTSEDRMNAMAELKKLKELLDIGAITEDEYNEKKRKIMDQI